MRLKIVYTFFALFILLSSSCYAEYGRGRYSSFNEDKKYIVKGEIEALPDSAVIKLVIKMESGSYEKSSKKLQELYSSIKERLQLIDKTHFSIHPSNISTREKSYKKSKAFFGSEESYKISIELNLKIKLFPMDFWKRSELISKVIDFLVKEQKLLKEKDNLSLYFEEPSYLVENIEKYRSAIIESVYGKSKKIMDKIAEREGKTVVVKKMSFSPEIEQRVIDMQKAYLSIDVNIEFGLQ